MRVLRGSTYGLDHVLETDSETLKTVKKVKTTELHIGKYLPYQGTTLSVLETSSRREKKRHEKATKSTN